MPADPSAGRAFDHVRGESMGRVPETPALFDSEQAISLMDRP
jgi:hypothetical protein